MSPSLSRTSSTTSISSVDDSHIMSDHSTPTASRRTRKRFSNAQLTMLENLFHQNSHPSREQREAVAAAGGMEVKSVTIWFQNKRQTERKVALHNPTGITGSPTSMSSSSSRRATHHHSTSSPFASPSLSNSSSSRPSLDHVASRTESRFSTPRTPTSRRHHNTNPTGESLWDHMPSSPLAPPASPPPREYFDLVRTKHQNRKTLEYACAAARHPDSSSKHSPGRRSRPRKHREKEALDLTDDEADEAITPPSTWGKDDPRWTASTRLSKSARTAMFVDPPGDVKIVNSASGTIEEGSQDEDMMRAALALCGLGRR
ncbi:homeobox-domain-containing protein, partial [Pluteus cervinus]